MAHIEQKNFFQRIKNKLPDYFQNRKVLEIGSLDINGTIREFFHECSYLGLDVGFGPGVDVVCEGQNYNAPNESFDIVCSAECFEHNPYWMETFKNMIRLCKEDGLVLFTCATDGRSEHGTTRTSPQDSPLTVGIGWDYYRNLNEDDFKSNLDLNYYFSDYGFEVNTESHDLYFWGIVSKNKLEKIPVIGVPIVNGLQWIERLIQSIDYPVKDLFIINNNGRGQLTEQLDSLTKIKHPYIDNIKVSHLPANIGCSGAWNLIIKCYMTELYWIIANHDIAFSPGLLKEMIEKSNDDVGIVKSKSFQWDLFLIKESTIQECGLFDENYYPAYMEDCDYHIRLLNKNIKISHIESEHYHGENKYENSGSQTLRVEEDLAEKLFYSHDTNSWYMSEKWGPSWRDLNWNFNPWKHPYNNSEIPITYTTYDLKFVRRKHLGF
jgi:SAM-dependent methyltransferase